MSAKFPTQAPTLYEEKSTANDVNDAAHWDGADANIVKEEIAAIATKVGIDGDMNPASCEYKIAMLTMRHAVTPGTGTLAASTSTVVDDTHVTGSSTVIVQARSSGFAALSPCVSALGSGSFTLTHSSAAGTETFDYIVVN